MTKRVDFSRSWHALTALHEDLQERESWDVAAGVGELIYELEVAEAQYKHERKTLRRSRSP